jgi:hypothetical protein
MKTATCLALIAIGAILTFAVTAHPSYLNLQVAGIVIMLTGAAGLFLPKPSQGWLHRRTILRRGPRGLAGGHVEETRYPPYVMLNPGAEHSGHHGLQPGDLTAAEAAEPAEPGRETAPIGDLPADDLAEDLTAEPVDPERPGTPVSEVVEEYIDE